MPLTPLKQWICDDCGEIIEKPEDGFVEWRSGPDHRGYGFRIVHHAPASPRHPHGDCYRYTNEPYRADLHLDEFLGPHGVVLMLSKIDVGSLHNREYAGPWVRDLREWTELFRRLQLPYYEEARVLWGRARGDSFFADANEVWPYLPETLKELVEQYGEQPEE